MKGLEGLIKFVFGENKMANKLTILFLISFISSSTFSNQELEFINENLSVILNQDANEDCYDFTNTREGEWEISENGTCAMSTMYRTTVFFQNNEVLFNKWCSNDDGFYPRKVNLKYPFCETILLKYSDDCCEENPISIAIKSNNSIDGLKMKGTLNAKMIGDTFNTITGPASLTFYREQDSKSFTVDAPHFGFKPPQKCIDDFFDAKIYECVLESPVTIEINSLMKTSYDQIQLISYEIGILKVPHLFSQQHKTSYDVYKVTNTVEEFKVEFLYNQTK